MAGACRRELLGSARGQSGMGLEKGPGVESKIGGWPLSHKISWEEEASVGVSRASV